jgi:ribosomal protein L37AE/L43A
MTEVLLKCPECGKDIVKRFVTLPRIIECPFCSHHVVKFRNIQGTIYVLSNPQMPGLFKIGFTARSIEERLSELNNATGVPASFVPECLVYSDRLEKDESEIHQALAQFRLPNKEFFACKRSKVLLVCESVCGRRPYFVREILPELGRGAHIVRNKFFCPKCGRRMTQLKGNKGWGCLGCHIFVDENGAPLK